MLNVELGQNKKIPKFDMTIFSERESLKRPKFYKNAHNVLHSGSNSIKTTLFLDSSHQYLSSDM